MTQAMAFRPCIIIPIYNHGDTIATTVARLAVHGLPIYIVDDGSDVPTQAALADVAAACPQVHLSRLPANQGKGAAVMDGMRRARRDGMSHALQIDADGQHDTGDVPRFLACGERHPDAVVCGQPIYDASVPKKRLYGRYVTHFWVWVETLSFAVRDSMCGFRLYPLAPTCALIDAQRIPARMAFDIEIIVRLCWAGLPVRNIRTRVTYPEGGLSHFDMLRDNLRISWMHTRLSLGMLPRLPWIVARRLRGAPVSAPAQAPLPQPHWTRITERGSALGLSIVAATYRLLGPRAVGWMLYPIIAYFHAAAGPARRASQAYLARVHACGGLPRPPRARDSFRHMMAFARSSVEKLAAWSGKATATRVHFPQQALFDELVASRRGALLVSAHLGNLEMARAMAHAGQQVTVNAVMYTDHAQRFHRMLSRVNGGFDFNLLQVSSLGPDTAILLQEKIDRGELLVIVGDRTPPGAPGQASRTCTADFLGEPALFPEGPFILASLLDCPVYLFFCLSGPDGYTIHFEPFAERIELPRRERKQRLQEYVRAYARRLESYCLAAPLQWFNFFDFWHTAAPPVPTPPRPAGEAPIHPRTE